MAVVFLLAAGSRVAAQTPAQQIDFNRPEAWALKYFSAVSTFTALGPPVVRAAGSIDFGLELGWIPSLGESQRRVGFDGTALEDLNKSPLFGRPRLTVGLPFGFSAEAAWVPPVGINGQRANLVAAALERQPPELQRGLDGLRHAQQRGPRPHGRRQARRRRSPPLCRR